MKIATVLAQNFGPFEQFETDLSRSGLTAIEGRVENRPGLSDNGAGKSTIFHAVTWAIYGRTMSPHFDKDDVVRRGAEEGAFVELKIRADKKTLTIIRYRSHKRYKHNVYFYINDKDATRGRNADTDAAIENTIGLDYASFMNSVMFGAREELKSFFTASDQERKRLFDVVLGLEVYDDAAEAARKHAREKRDERVDRASKLETHRSRLSERKKLLKQLDAQEHDPLSYKESLARANFARKRARSHTEIAEWLSNYIRIQKEKYEERERIYQQVKSSVEGQEKEIHRRIREAEKEKGGWERELSRSRKRLEKLEDLSAATCPMCEQSVPHDHVAMLMSYEQDTKREANHKIEATDLEIDYRQQELDALKYPPKPSDEELEHARREKEAFEDNAAREEKAAQVEESKAKREKQELENHRAKRDEAAKAVESAREKIKTEKKRVNELDRDIELYDFWAESFGARGIRSFLIENELPKLNKRATSYARRLLGKGTRIRLEATTQLKSKKESRERLSVEASIPGMAQTYAAASKGQRQRLDLSILLAFRDLVSERSSNPFDQLFVDELFDGLDASGRESVVELLGETADRCPVALITHDPSLKRAARRVILAFHDGERAELRESS